MKSLREECQSKPPRTGDPSIWLSALLKGIIILDHCQVQWDGKIQYALVGIISSPKPMVNRVIAIE